LPTVTQLDDGLYLIDLHFQGQPGVIASYLIEDAGERALIEIGPTSTLDTLLSALQTMDIDPDSISKVLVTHVHLDHAGASGTFMRRFPESRLFVHEMGAPHMIDPSRLVTSATRIYGDMMDTLWGAIEPVREDQMSILVDGDTVTVGKKRLAALYTPGHASHHVAFHDIARDAVFTGDVGAVRLQDIRYVRPATPPPDIDLELWSESLERIKGLHPRVLYVTHFGPFSDVTWHLQEARDQLYEWGAIVQRAMQSGQDREEIVDLVRRHGDGELLQLTDDPSVAVRYELSTPYGMSVDGYLRYYRKRAPATTVKM
jgi:glyoxylase-like metal-dependent hydrolase (beta-lactamase superfamily II)